MSLFNKKGMLDQEVAASLGLQPGDIILSELLGDDAERKHFEKFTDFVPGHSCVWVGPHQEKPFVRSSREIYTPPGLRLSGLWEGRHVVFRYIDVDAAALFARIMENWAHEDQDQFSMQSRVSRASNDSVFSLQNPNPMLSQDGILLAFCFAAMRENLGEPYYRSGQRCTSMLTAAFQASLLASIVKSNTIKSYFKQIKECSLDDFLDEIAVMGWRETTLGKKIIDALEQKDFSGLFPLPFAVDLHDAHPRTLYNKLTTAIEFVHVGSFSFFENELVAIEKNELEDDLGRASSL